MPQSYKIYKDTTSQASKYFSEGMYVVNHNMNFLDNEKFMSIFNNTAENNYEKGTLWRSHIVTWAFERGCKLEGDLVECGVYRGFRSFVAAQYTNFSALPKTLWLYDTWNGVPDDQLNNGHISNTKFKDPDNFVKVQERFSKFNNVKMVQGRVPEVLNEQSPRTISFLHVDVNSAQAELGTLKCLFNRLTPGSVCLLDDVGSMYYHENCKQTTKWLNEQGYSVMELPTGQGIVIK